MIIEMHPDSSQAQVKEVEHKARSLKLDVQMNLGTSKTIVALLGDNTGQIDTDLFAVLPGVQSVTRVMKPYKLASREFKQDDTTINIDGLTIGDNRIIVMAGPCAVENKEQLMEAARAIKRAGASVLRGGAFKPRTSPFSFQGLGKDGLELLVQAKDEVGLPIITEVLDTQHVNLVSEYADILQIGARNMQNFNLLTKVGKTLRPALLKRGLSASVTEWMAAADYLLAQNNTQVSLCERGIRTFETSSRFSLDICSIPVVKQNSHLPLIVDPSHAAGHYSLVSSIAKAAVAAGADGLIIEVHPNPKEAMSDGLQALTPSDFARLMEELKPIAASLGRTI